MNKQFLKDSLGWGFILWIVGYALGIVLFMLVPTRFIGWIITLIGSALTVWVLGKKIHGTSITYYAQVGIVWALVAMVCDYVLLVSLFNINAYYKLDVYVYYVLMLLLPLVVGWRKLKK